MASRAHPKTCEKVETYKVGDGPWWTSSHINKQDHVAFASFPAVADGTSINADVIAIIIV